MIGLFATYVPCGGFAVVAVTGTLLEFGVQLPEMFIVLRCMRQTFPKGEFPTPNVNSTLVGKNRARSYNVGCIIFNHYQIL